jgi:glycerol-1-phosphate dehydrogenase [NAD(P)+]
MPLLARTVNTPLAIEVRRGAVAELDRILADQRISAGGEVAVVVGPGQGEAVARLLRPRLGAADLFAVAGGSLAAAQELGAKLRQGSYDAVVGIGGGKTIDVAKWVASRYALPMVSVATSLVHDGLASPVATLDHDGGRGSYGVHIPIAVVVDLDFVAAAPASFTRAGVGEVLSNLSAVADWWLANECRGEPVDGLAMSMARVGAEAILHHPADLSDDGFLTLLAESLISSGIAMSVCGSSRPCSGGCHEISHAINILYPGTASHGEQVGVGALFCTFLRGDRDRFAQLVACMVRHGLPTGPGELGLTGEQFVAAVLAAPRTRPERYTILEHLDLDEPAVVDRLADFEAAVRAQRVGRHW